MSLRATFGAIVAGTVQVGGVCQTDDMAKTAVKRVTLGPQAHFSGQSIPTRQEIDAMHNEAHEECYITDSVES
jgi:organic hydroperoxide reductase OsmC/OhrA